MHMPTTTRIREHSSNQLQVTPPIAKPNNPRDQKPPDPTRTTKPSNRTITACPDCTRPTNLQCHDTTHG